jgi:hypothetical protein
VIIAGLGRSGTTHLHALLAASGAFRYLRTFEASNFLASVPDTRLADSTTELAVLQCGPGAVAGKEGLLATA